MDKEQLTQVEEAVRNITLARAQISDSINLLQRYFPTIKATGTLPAEQTLNSLRRSIRAIDRIVKSTPKRLSE